MLELGTLKSLNVTCASVIRIPEKKNYLVCIQYDSPVLRLLKQKYLHSETLIYEIYHEAPPHLRLLQSLCSTVLSRIIKNFVISLLKRNITFVSILCNISFVIKINRNFQKGHFVL